MSSARSRENSPEPAPSLARDIAETETIPCTPRESSRNVAEQASSISERSVAGPSKPVSGAGALPPNLSFAPSPSRSTTVRTVVRPPTLVEPPQAKSSRWRSPVMPRTDSYMAVPCGSFRPTVVRASSLTRARSPSYVSPKSGSRSVNVASPCNARSMFRDFRMPVTQGPPVAVTRPAPSPQPLKQCRLSPKPQPALVLHAVPVASPVQAIGRAAPAAVPAPTAVPASMIRSAVSLYALPAAMAAATASGKAAPALGPRAQARHIQSPRQTLRPIAREVCFTGSPAAAAVQAAPADQAKAASAGQVMLMQVPHWAYAASQPAHQVAAAPSLPARENTGERKPEVPSTMPMCPSRPLL